MNEYQRALILERLADAKERRDRIPVGTYEYYTAAGECDALNYVCGVLGLREYRVRTEDREGVTT